MPFNGSGVFQRLYSWVTDRDNSVKINAPRMDGETDGIVAGINAIVDQTQPFINAVKVPSGTAALPGYAFTTDPNTGAYNPAADQWAVSLGGTQALLLTSAAVTSTVPYRAPIGAASAPAYAFSGATSTGFYMPSLGGGVSLSISNSEYVNFLQTAAKFKMRLLSPNGSPTVPTYSFEDYPAFGLYTKSTGPVFAANSTDIAEFRETGILAHQPLIGSGARSIQLLAQSVGGTENAISITCFEVSSLLPGQQVRFVPAFDNTGPATLALDGGSALACKTMTGAALPAGYIRAGVPTVATKEPVGTWVVDRDVEYGTNANGEYWRYADGRQICALTLTSVQTPNVAAGAIFRGAGETWTYPIAFSAAPACSATPAGATRWASIAPPTPSAVDFTVLTHTSSGASSAVRLMAMGRWY